MFWILSAYWNDRYVELEFVRDLYYVKLTFTLSSFINLNTYILQTGLHSELHCRNNMTVLNTKHKHTQENWLTIVSQYISPSVT